MPPRASRKRFRVVLIAVAFLAVALLAGWALTRTDPRERTWEEALSTLPPQTTEPLPPEVNAIVAAGPEAIPFLLRRLEGSFAQRTLHQYWDELPQMIRSRLTRPRVPYRNHIPLILEEMGPLARPALPRLRRIFLDDPENHLNTLNAIATIGRNDPRTFEFLASVAVDPKMSRFICGNTAYHLGFWSPSEEVVDVLIQLYHHPHPDVTQYACAALGRQGPAALKAFPLLKAALTNADSTVRSAAFPSLRLIDTNGAQAIPILREFARHPDPEIAAAAAYELQRFGTFENP